MKFFHAKKFFPQLHIAVHQRHGFMHSFNKLLIDFHRNMASIQSCFQVRCILMCLRQKCLLLHIGTIHGSQRISPVTIDSIHSFKGIFSHLTVPALHERHITSMGHLHRMPIFPGNLRKTNIRIVKHGENILRAFCHLSHSRQKLFLFCGQDMFFLSYYIFKILAVYQKLFIFIQECLNDSVRQLHELWLHKRQALGEFH